MADIPLPWFLMAGAILFCIGVFLVITRRNAVVALIGVELMLNAANINFVAFAQYDPLKLSGQMASLFIIVLAAAEIAVGLAIVLNVYKRFKTANIDEINTLKE